MNQDIQIEITGTLQQTDRVYDGREVTRYHQEAYLHRPSEKYPEKVSFQVEDANKALPLGFYNIDFDNSLQVGQWNSLGFSRFLQLVPVKQNVQKAG